MRSIILAIAAGASLLSASLTGPAIAKTHTSPAVIAARQKIFGLENVDPRNGTVREDRVVFSWLTNATFAAAVKGHVLLLDTYVTRLEVQPGRTPFVIQDLVDVDPDFIFIGHGHFDHADNAAYIAQQTGAIIFASPDTCDNMAIDATNNLGRGYTTVPTVTCKPLTSRGSLPGAEIVPIHDLEPFVSVSAFRHLHSTNTGVTDPDAVPIAATAGGVCQPTAKGNTFPCNLQDPRDPLLFPAGTPLSSVMNIGTSRSGAGGPISIFYVFTVKGPERFRFVWHNSTGDIIDSCALPNNNPATGQPFEPGQAANGCFPGVTLRGKTVGANLASIMDSLGPVDVELGSVVSLGYNQNGERDIVSYLEHVRPRYFIPNHVTAVAAEGSSLEWREGFLKALDAAGVPPAQRPQTLWLVDPNDYLRPLVFNLNDPHRF
jgi:L-ascorbate metabolism protein UlaG (beta-lactamase superfamily)